MSIHPTSKECLDFLWFGRHCLSLQETGNKAISDSRNIIVCKYTPEKAVLIFIRGDGNFICYPRSGDVKQKNYLRGDGMVIPYWYVDGPGFDDEGKALNIRSLTNAAYPSLQTMPNGPNGPWGAKAYSKEPTDTEWSYITDVSPYYGNTDWKGPSTDDNNSSRLVLTWCGSPSRYFPGNPTIAEEIGFPVLTELVFKDSNIYATLPKAVNLPLGKDFPYAYLQTELGDAIPYVVLGAAINGDWLVVCARWFAQTISGQYYNFFSVLAVSAGSTSTTFYHEKDNPGGWRLLYSQDLTSFGRSLSAFSSWFFNETGTEAVCAMRGNLYKIVVDMENFTATPSLQEKFVAPLAVGKGSKGFEPPIDKTTIQQKGGKGSRTNITTGGIDYLYGKYLIAADYKGLLLVKAYISHIAYVKGISTSKETYTRKNVYDKCANKYGSLETETNDIVKGTDGEYEINLELPTGKVVIGSGYEIVSSTYNYISYSDTLQPLYSEMIVRIGGPSGVAIGSTYYAGGGGGGPYTYRMDGGDIDPITGIVLYVDTSCSTNGGRTFATIKATNACNNTAEMEVYFDKTAGTWVVASCDVSCPARLTYCATAPSSPQWQWIGTESECQPASWTKNSVTMYICRWSGYAWIQCGSITWERVCL